MNFTTQLSIKSALRFALPCLASCLLLTACSNEGSELNPDDANPTAPGSIRFTASAPLASDAATTRIGIDSDNKPDVTDENDWDRDEPIIWLEGDAVSVFFAPKDGGEAIHAKFLVDDESISSDGKSAELISDSDFDPSELDGEYTIYAFSPYDPNNTFNNITLDLTSQSQAVNADATNYSHLGNTAYMHANAGDASFDNGALTDGEVNLAFEHVTSFLRFNIKNGFDDPITVSRITVSHPNLITEASYNLQFNTQSTVTQGNALELTFGASGHTLSPGGSFDAYLSTLPISLLTNKNQALVFSFYITDEPDPIVYTVNLNELAAPDDSECFAAATRFLINMSLSSDDPENDLSLFITDDFILTWDKVSPSVTGIINASGLFVSLEDALTSCPENYTYVDQSFFTTYIRPLEKTPTARYKAIQSNLTGYVGADGQFYLKPTTTTTHNFGFAFVSSSGSGRIVYLTSMGYSASNLGSDANLYRPLCYRMLP